MKTVIFICGPTAIGKTSVAIEIAKWLQTEIISFDSRQFFKELKIGAAPPNEKDLQEIPHHLIGNLSLKEDYSSGKFEKEALQLIQKLFETKDQIVLVGGSGLYMKVLCEGFDEMPEVNPEVRENLRQELRNQGLDKLLLELKNSDPIYYNEVDKKNPQRIVRALEIIRTTAMPFSSFRKRKKINRPFNIIKIGLNMNRENLYQRINLRVDKMMESGLLEEVKSLLQYKEHNSFQTVGYREFVPFFNDEINLDQAVEEVKKNSRRYAKRQLTWFKKDEEIKWFHPERMEDIKKELGESLSE
tara:strand:+ start:1665 stop:2567 length:903 start_codon:yes stop_codon:yes gene_type:complete